MRISLFWRMLPVHIVIALLVALPYWQQHKNKALAEMSGNQAQAQLETVSKNTAPARIEGLPTRILIPNLLIDLDVYKGVRDQNSTWLVSPESANYATNTALTNNKADSTLIYGHAISSVFGATKELKTGDVVYIYTDNGHIFKYTYNSKSIVKPTDLQIFDNLEGSPGLVLMTCEGNWYQNRRLMFFDLVEST